MFSLAAHTADDRGRRVTLFSARGQPRARFDADPGLREIVERLAASASLSLNERVSLHQVLIFVPFIIAPVAIAILNSFIPGLPPWVGTIFLAAGLVVLMPIAMAIGSARIANRTRATFLREGRCPSCAYTLAGLPAEADGCTACPECSAAWMAASIGFPTIPVAAPPTAGDINDTADAAPTPPVGPARSTRASAVDALDRVIRLRDPLLRDLDPARAAAIGDPRVAVVRSAVRSAARARMITMTLLWLCFGLLTGASQSMVAFGLPGPPRAWPAVMALLMIFFCGSQIYRVLTYRSRSTAYPAAKALIEHQLCPACAGDLTAAPDSFRSTCSTCRAVWKATGV